jgi:hypothetical protein
VGPKMDGGSEAEDCAAAATAERARVQQVTSEGVRLEMLSDRHWSAHCWGDAVW